MKTLTPYVLLALLLLLAIWLHSPTYVLADDYKPITREFELAAPGANTDALTDITWRASTAARVTIQVDVSSIVNLMVNRAGTENALGLNANQPLTAGAVYTFDVHGVQPGDILNVQVETDGTIPMLAIGELRLNR